MKDHLLSWGPQIFTLLSVHMLISSLTNTMISVSLVPAHKHIDSRHFCKLRLGKNNTTWPLTDVTCVLLCVLQLAQPCGGKTTTQDASSDSRLPSQRPDVSQRSLQSRPARSLAGLQSQPLQPRQCSLHPAHPPQALKRAIDLTAQPVPPSASYQYGHNPSPHLTSPPQTQLHQGGYSTAQKPHT